MCLWAIIPVKPFHASKSRLARVLSSSERTTLSRDFLARTLDVLRQVPAVTRTLVVSRDLEALSLARERGACALTEVGEPGLNAALRAATEEARSQGARAVLVLPTDLPTLSVEDVIQLTAESAGATFIVVAPDRHEAGTNALLVRPPGLIEYAFGPKSFEAHCALAERAGAPVRVCRLPGVALDVDVPADLRLYRSTMRL
jgi:2-phospho-L-lactate guanylyltransferase